MAIESFVPWAWSRLGLTQGHGLISTHGAQGSGVTPVNDPPVISNVSPAVSSPILTTTVISFDITDDSGLFRRILIKAEFVILDTWDLVFDGDDFGPLYQGPSNTRTAISGGYHYTILRDGGWTIGVPPILTPYAIDRDGSENA